MIYLLLLGATLLVGSQVLTHSIRDGDIDFDGVIRRPLPLMSGSLILSGALFQVAIGVKSYRRNRVYYRLSVVVK